MIFKKFQYIIILILLTVQYTKGQVVLGVYHHGISTNTDCLTPDRMRGSCVPAAKCRRIEWLLQNWSAPYPERIVQYIRQSHCGTRGEIHFNCCAFYDIKGYIHPPTHGSLTTPAYGPFEHNLHHPFHSGQSQYLPNFSQQFQNHHPTASFRQQQQQQQQQPPFGERILHSMTCGRINGDRISHGEIVRLSEFPWMVLLESEGVKSRQRFRCAGTLITNQYVLTAGHCAEAKNEVISVRLGEHNLKTEHDCENYSCAPDYEDVAIERIIIHPDYKANNLQNDIALIRLARPVQFQSHIKPVCLPLATEMYNQIPAEQIVAGWGVTEKGYASDVLLKATLLVQPIAICQNIYQPNPHFTNEKLCAGGVDKRSTCRADSGGPLFAAIPYNHSKRRYVQFGITSGGSFGCGGKHNLPGIYTNVRTFVPWIIANIY